MAHLFPELLFDHFRLIRHFCVGYVLQHTLDLLFLNIYEVIGEPLKQK